MIFKPKSRRSGEERRIGDEMKNEWKAYTYEPSDEKRTLPRRGHPDPTKRPVGGEDAPTPGGETGEPDTAFGRQEAHVLRSRGLAPSKDRGKRRRATGMPPTKTRGAVMSAITPIGGRRRWERHAIHAAKVRERIERRAYRHYHRHSHRKDRVEWWNHDPNVQTRSGFIGDIYLGHDYWELKPMNISHFIGDTVLDLTKAQILPGETVINISSFIGDVKIYLQTITRSAFKWYPARSSATSRCWNRRKAAFSRTSTWRRRFSRIRTKNQVGVIRSSAMCGSRR